MLTPSVDKTAAHLGVRRTESPQRNELANAALAVQASDVGSKVPARLVRGGLVERRRLEDPAPASDARARREALLSGGPAAGPHALSGSTVHGAFFGRLAPQGV